MSSEQRVVELHLDKDQNYFPGIFQHFNDIVWIFSIQRNNLGFYLEIECDPSDAYKYWELEIFFDLKITKTGSDIKSRIGVTPTFSNYSNVITVLQLEDGVNGVVLNFKCPDPRVFKFSKNSLFDEPVEHISDTTLMVEGQKLHVCKKILATYSSYFYNLFYNYEDCCETEHVISVPCNSFRVFLALLYNQDSFLTEFHHYPSIFKLSSQFNAPICRHKCEVFLIRANLLDYLKILKNFQVDTDDDSQHRHTLLTKVEPNLTDVMLSVGDKKFYVSKQLLAYHSSYFYTMFYSDFAEKGKEEIELKEIDDNEFEMFLHFVYNSNLLITSKLISMTGNQFFTVENVEALFTLSQMYDVQPIVQKCIKFLEVGFGINDVKKIQIAANLNVLEHVLSKIQFADLPRFFKMDGFNELDDSTIASITRLLVDKKNKLHEAFEQIVSNFLGESDSDRFSAPVFFDF